ncbi:hypothetical protein CRG98_044986 [Punica granatum]|uniref:Disease resistance protein At4g27190-like leucine-rich repeats domain-containing protein n=1 Tax=Punica granatum TaxID=22663 RepID=A0A2I0HSC0_PUNGR|nr:hypothetical protein CRG98_044986 [Punica granatum]
MTLFISVSSIYLSAVTLLTIDSMEDEEHLPVELFGSLPSLVSLIIRECHRLKDLCGRAILRYLPALESLEISYCEELDLSIEDDDNDGDDERKHGLQQQGHCKLRHLMIIGIEKMEALPGWLQYLSNLKYLGISHCHGLKSLLPGRLILPLLSTLERWEQRSCPELDSMGPPDPVNYKMGLIGRWIRRNINRDLIGHWTLWHINMAQIGCWTRRNRKRDLIGRWTRRNIN